LRQTAELGGFAFLVVSSLMDEAAEDVRIFFLAVNSLIAVGMIIAALVARRHPLRGIAIGLLV
jgi:hypothetical protein